MSSWVQTCFPIQDSSWATWKENRNVLISPSHFISTWRFGFKQIWCHGRHVSHPSQKRDRWWRLTQKLLNRDSGRQVWKDRCSWNHERTHSSRCTSKSRLALSSMCENKKMFDETLNVYPHKEVHIDIDPNVKPVHLCLTQYLESIWRLLKSSLTNLLDLVS